MAALSALTVKRLIHAIGDVTAGNEVVTAINGGDAVASTQTLYAIADVITATSTSQTTDFGTLAVGDKVLMVPATAGNADFISPGVAGNLGQAAVVGNVYLVLRAITIPTASAVKL